MKELVDKQVVLEIIDNIETDFSYWAVTDGIIVFKPDAVERIKEKIENIPPKDFGNGLHCKDCCYRLECPLDGFEYCTWHNSFVDTDAFCSYGKTNLED